VSKRNAELNRLIVKEKDEIKDYSGGVANGKRTANDEVNLT
jgi:hypothetical protein